VFNLGGGELFMIFLLALIVLGPQKLPEAARKIGGFMGELRRLSSGFQAEVRNALEDPELARPENKPPNTPPSRNARPARATKPVSRSEAVAAPEPSDQVDHEVAVAAGAGSEPDDGADAEPAASPTVSLDAARPDASPSPGRNSDDDADDADEAPPDARAS
jgi:sec-independent protein translocase protein TatB